MSSSGWVRTSKWSPFTTLVQASSGVTISPTLLGPVLVWSSKNIIDCCWPWGISSPPRAAVPATLPRGKASLKMNEFWPLVVCFLLFGPPAFHPEALLAYFRTEDVFSFGKSIYELLDLTMSPLLRLATYAIKNEYENSFWGKTCLMISYLRAFSKPNICRMA